MPQQLNLQGLARRRPWQTTVHLTPAHAAMWHHRDPELRAHARTWLRKKTMAVATEHQSALLFVYAGERLVYCALLWSRVGKAGAGEDGKARG